MQERLKNIVGTEQVHIVVANEEEVAMACALSVVESINENVKGSDAVHRVTARVAFILQAFLGCCLAAGADADEMVDFVMRVYNIT